jgi:uncharacterized membrane protein YphA (DoxX/SURF4 family)
MWLSLFAYFLLRVAVGGCLILIGYRHLKGAQVLARDIKPRFPLFNTPLAFLFGATELVVGLMIFLGFSTQYAALIGMIMCFKVIVLYRRLAHPLLPSRMFYGLLFATLLSLFITGAGALAFDLPL